MSDRVVIVGAGLTGALLATMLGQRGYDVAVYVAAASTSRSPPAD
jgi:2-polyprenyl-6-methoxyphenol hydroxylase-like FAD-dependent oxidoreductase